eukprot:GHVS01041814.1.p2 GENE.GHVS01041814.1~~GHVS01041814.1.p2  ORF type:complete len:228 (+),score=28.71 GHVS01041814.1:149-832(+)
MSEAQLPERGVAPSFNGKEGEFAVWAERFEAFLRLRKLDAVITSAVSEHSEVKNKTVWDILVQCLDSTSLMSVLKAKPDGRRAWEILKAHHASQEKPRLLSQEKTHDEETHDEGTETISQYLLRAELLSKDLSAASQPVPEDMLISLVLNGLQGFEYFKTIHAMSKTHISYEELCVSLKNFSDGGGIVGAVKKTCPVKQEASEVAYHATLGRAPSYGGFRSQDICHL